MTTGSSGADDGLFISGLRKYNFETTYYRREIINGSRVEFGGSDAESISRHIEDMGWTPMITMNLPVYPRLVRLFYCNLENNLKEKSITSLVNGTVIRLDCSSLAVILGIPNEGTEYYDGYSPGPRVKYLTVKKQCLFDLLVSILVPRLHLDTLSYMYRFLLEKILRGKRVNLCYIIMRHMISCTSTHLPYGMLLTKVFNSFNVVIGPEEEVETMNPEYQYRRLRRGWIRTYGGWSSGNVQHGGGDDDAEEVEQEEGDKGEAEEPAMETEAEAAMEDEEGRAEEPATEDKGEAEEPAMEDEGRAEEPATKDKGESSPMSQIVLTVPSMKTPRRSPDGGASDRDPKRRTQPPSSCGSSDANHSSLTYPSCFERIYRRRKIINGSRVEFVGLEAESLRRDIEAMGWTPMITMDLPVYPRLVRLFYCNLQCDPSETWIASVVNGTVIRLDCPSLAAILGIPNEGIEHYPGAAAAADSPSSPRGPRAKKTSRPAVISAQQQQQQRLFDMLVSVFVPRRHNGRPSEMDKFLLDKIVCRKRVNLCYIIIRHMIEFIWRDVHLPYGMLLSKVFNSLNVVISPEEEFETMSSEFHFERVGREGGIRTYAEWNPGSLKHDAVHQEVEMEDEGRAEEPAMEDEGRGEEPVMEDERRAEEPVMEDEGRVEETATETDSVHDPLRDPTVRIDSVASTVQDHQSQREQEFGNLNKCLGKLTARVDSMDNKLTSQVASAVQDIRCQQQQVLTNLNESLSKVAARVDSVDNKLNARVDTVASAVQDLRCQQEQVFTKLNQSLSQVASRVDSVDSKLNAQADTVASAVQSLKCQQEKRFADLNSKLDSLFGFLNHHFCPYPPPPTPFEG